MTEMQYQQISESICRRKYGKLIINLLDNLITLMIFASYPILLVYSYFFAKTYFLELIAVPLCSFIAVTLFRKAVNAERPYEVYDFTPIIDKDTKKHSFPSRHVFAAFMVGMSYLQISGMGCFDIFILGFLLAIIRVFGGVHFIKDVVVGALLGVLMGYVGFYIIF